MKAHIRVNAKEGIVHSVCSTAASVSDARMLPDLVHSGENKVCAIQGIKDRPEPPMKLRLRRRI
jgi:transposase, IS5 family